MSYGLNVEMHKQTEICKRLDAIIRQVSPFLSSEHQQQVAVAVERAKQITMQELNAVMQQAASGGIPGMPPGLPGLPPPGTPGLPPGLAGLPGLPPTTAGGLLSLAGHPGLPPVSGAGPGGLPGLPGNPLQSLMGARPPNGNPDPRDEKPHLSAIEERLKNSSSASPLSARSLPGGPGLGSEGNRGRSPAPGGPPNGPGPNGGPPSTSRSPSSASGGAERRPGSRSAEDASANKRIKMEGDGNRKGHVSLD